MPRRTAEKKDKIEREILRERKLKEPLKREMVDERVS